jgi:superfamily II DNA or RNA helicase
MNLLRRSILNNIDVNIYSFKYLQKKQLTDKIIGEIKKDLTLFTLDYITESYIANKFFYEDNDNLMIPRNYEIEKKFPQFTFNEKDNTTDGKDIKIVFEGKLRDVVQEQSSKFLIKNRYGLLQLPPGTGKTVISIYALCKLKKKTLIIVDKEKLMTQWIDRLIEFTNLNKDDIGVYQAENKQLDKPIVIAMAQSMLSNLKRNGIQTSKDFYNSDFGITIIDEAHVIFGSQLITNIAGLMFSKRMMALTATPDRGDDTTKVIFYWMSDKIFEYKKYNMMPTVKIYFFDSKLRTSKTHRYICWGNKFNLLKYNQQLLKKDFFNNIIKKLIYKSYEKNRFPIALAQLRKQLTILNDLLQNDYKLTEDDIGLFIGGSKEEEKNKKIVLSTFQMTSKGVDNKHWDTMFLINSFSKHTLIEQAIGRILREKEGKQQPVVFDFVDLSYQMLINMYKKRKRLYDKLNFEIQFYRDSTVDDANTKVINDLVEY